MFSIFDVIGNNNDTPFDDTGYRKERQASPNKSNRELTGGWRTAATEEKTSHHTNTNTDSNFSIFDEISRF